VYLIRRAKKIIKLKCNIEIFFARKSER